jgi:hypothetical protein
MNTLRTADLSPGDVLLFHGNGLLSRFIRLFDGSDYSHAAIFDGENVVEAEAELGNGICVDSVEKACSSASYVHVYRFMSKDGERFNNLLPYAPVATQVDAFKKTPESYAYSQILLLGILLASRRVPIPGIAPILRHFLDEAAEKLNDWLNVGRKVIICSELVYKCFYDVRDDRYAIDVPGVDPSVVSVGLESRATLMPQITPDTDTAHLQKDAAAFLATYRLAKPEMTLPNATGAGGEVLAIPEFVTPRDLATSPNLLLIGQLVP